jgi:hypothetical protein
MWTNVDAMKRKKVHITARIKQSSKEFVEKYAEKNEISESECIDFLLFEGIKTLVKPKDVADTGTGKNLAKPKATKPRFVPPEYKEVFEYMFFKTQNQDYAEEQAEVFINHYTNVGWKIGKSNNVMKDWKAAVSNWVKRSFNNGQQTNKSQKSASSNQNRARKFSTLASMFDDQ